MTGHDYDDDYAETQVLPGRIDADEPDTEETVVLDDEYRRRIERGLDPGRDRSR